MLIQWNQRWRAGRASYRPSGETIRPAEYEVARIDETTAKAFVLRHHYSGSYPAARRRYGLYRGAQLVGVAVYSQPVRNEVLTNVFDTGSAHDSVELGRFILLDEVPANGETWFLARTFEQLRRERFVGVLAFSDPLPRTSIDGTIVFRGHVGTIYQAASCTALGRGTARRLHLMPDGSVFSPRACQKLRKREQGWGYALAQLVCAGAVPPGDGEDMPSWLRRALSQVCRSVPHRGCFKFGWALHRSARRFLDAQARPYPKELDELQLLLPHVAGHGTARLEPGA